MDPADFVRLKEALHTAGRLSAAERSAYLAGLAAEDPALHREVQAILAQDSASLDLVRAMKVEDLVESIKSRTPTRAMPVRIGPYRIAGVLGEGGMGVVYRAEQTQPIRREVALKLMRPGLDSHRVARRFEAERQTLALMDHPNIARVFDAGTDEHGAPYFVMELVRGVPVTDYCRDHAVPLRRRLKIFRSICRAVQHAHQKGTIHRDLKPSNLLVASENDEPLPKVIDFGVAKALQPDAEAPGLTHEGQLVGTIEYMSPEQARGLPGGIDTRSDVYSLGVVLYELVIGELPYDVRRLPIPDAIRVITDDPPPPARQTATSERLDPDLDTIMRKALEKEPDRRYAGVGALADDIDRFLHADPILARRASNAYQLRKFIARHKVPVAAIATTMVLMLAFGIGMTLMFRHEQYQRRRAERETHRAERTSAFMEEVLLGSDPGNKGANVTVREMLEAARSRLERGPAEEPEIEASVRTALAMTLRSVGDNPDSEEEIHRALAALDRADHDVGLQRAGVLETLGAWRYYDHQLAVAESLWQEALAIRRARVGTDPEAVGLLNNLAMARAARGDLAGAESQFRELMAIGQRLRGPHIEGLSLWKSNLARVVQRQGRLEEAESLYREALAEAGPEGFGEMMWLGSLLGSRGRYTEADSLLAASLEGFQRRAAGENSWLLIGVQIALGELREDVGSYAEAESLLEEAVALCDRTPTGNVERLAGALRVLGSAQAALGRLDEAEEAETGGLTAAQSVEVDSNRGALVSLALRGLADVRRAEGKGAEADSLLGAAASLDGEATPPDHFRIASTLLDRGMLLVELDRPRDAEPLLRRSRDEFRVAGWGDEWPSALAASELAASLASRGIGAAESRALWAESQDVLLRQPSPVPHALRKRALEHAVAAMSRDANNPNAAVARAAYVAALAR